MCSQPLSPGMHTQPVEKFPDRQGWLETVTLENLPLEENRGRKVMPQLARGSNPEKAATRRKQKRSNNYATSTLQNIAVLKNTFAIKIWVSIMLRRDSKL